jgi:tRNA-specific 2-thiouridylase
VGEHGGQHRFTVGQRRGVGVALGYPIYVVEKDPASNTVTVGPRERLAVEQLEAWEANWHADASVLAAWTPMLAQHRAHGEAVACRVRVLGDADRETPSGRRGRFELVYERAEHGVAPGQAVVLYDPAEPERVVGGGWIAKTVKAGVATGGSETEGNA